MRTKIINDLNLKNNIYFNQIKFSEKKIHITKCKIQANTVVEIRELCNIQTILEKYEKYSDVKISLDEVIIELK